MPRPRRRAATVRSPRRSARNRHGRGLRSSVAGPHLPMLRTREGDFELIVSTTAAYLRGLWPDELAGVRFEVAQAPAEAIHDDHVDRWKVHHDSRRIVLYRLPIVRFAHAEDVDELHERMLIESCVFRAVADLLDTDPWDLAPNRYRGF